MVVSRDFQEVSVLECILGGLQIDVDVETQPERAQSKLAKSKVDALIVDCDLTGSDRFLRNLQHDSHFPVNTPLVVMSGPRARRELDATGALFTFEKPISVENAVRTVFEQTTIADIATRHRELQPLLWPSLLSRATPQN